MKYAAIVILFVLACAAARAETICSIAAQGGHDAPPSVTKKNEAELEQWCRATAAKLLTIRSSAALNIRSAGYDCDQVTAIIRISMFGPPRASRTAVEYECDGLHRYSTTRRIAGESYETGRPNELGDLWIIPVTD